MSRLATKVKEDNVVDEEEEGDTKKEDDFLRRCRVRVIGLRGSGKGSLKSRNAFSY